MSVFILNTLVMQLTHITKDDQVYLKSTDDHINKIPSEQHLGTVGLNYRFPQSSYAAKSH